MSTKLHQRPPFRAEHLGSLLRPAVLLQKKSAWEKKQAPKDELTAIEDDSINNIIKEQLDLGFHAVTDGEYRRHMFWYDCFLFVKEILELRPSFDIYIANWTVYRGTFFPGLDGFEEIENPDVDMFRMHVPDIAAFLESGHKPGETVICTGKIKHVGSTYM